MKRHWLLIFALVMVFVLCSCGKTEAAKACESLIDSIGEVTLESEDAIKAAEDAYDSLSEDEKTSVKRKYNLLGECRDEYDRLDQEERIRNVVSLIDEIGEVTLRSEMKIKNAEKAYNKLSDEEKKLISEKAQALTAARAAYNTVVMEANADKVITSIDKIGVVTLEKLSDIEAIEEEYSALKPEEQKLVTNYAVLEKALTDVKSLAEAENQKILKEILPKFNIIYDKVQNITFYAHKNQPQYVSDRCYLIPYIAVRNGQPFFLLRYNYMGEDWVFFEDITIVVDNDDKYYRSASYYDITRDNGGRKVWEYWHEELGMRASLDTETIQMLYKIAESKETIVRFSGDDYHYDYTVIDADKEAIRDVLRVYSNFLRQPFAHPERYE